MVNVANFAVSFQSVGGALSLFAIAFGLIGFVGGAVGYFAKGRADAIIKAQAELIDVRDRQITDLKEQNAGLCSENKVLAEQNETLKGLAQGSPQLVELTKQIKGLPKEIARIIVRAMKEAK